jgi:hypothetical protein
MRPMVESHAATSKSRQGEIYPTLTLPLQRGGNKISSFPPLQGGIKGGESDLWLDDGRFFSMSLRKMGTSLFIVAENETALNPI